MSPEFLTVRLLEALEFASDRHRDQRRKGAAREPYINHLIQVTYILAESGARDPALLVAAALHDVIEDTWTTAEEVADRFGVDVRDLVLEVTDDKSLPKEERKRLQVLGTASKSDRARMLKMADKTANLRSLMESPPTGWSPQRLENYVYWSGSVAQQCIGLLPELDRRFEDVYKAALERFLRE